MKCFCGCGEKRRGRQADLNLQAGQLAVELLAWDKARAEGRLGPPASDDAPRLIEQGADCYQRLLLAMHGEPEAYSIEEGEDWLARSRAERSGRQHMTTKEGIFTRAKLRLTDEDYERLDRAHPELSFSGTAAPRAANGAAASQLQRLEALHAEGVLTDAELAAARARLPGGGP